VAYLLIERTVKPLLGNGFVIRNNGISVGSGVFCAILAGAIYQGAVVITGES
jgi:hypothetical protein